MNNRARYAPESLRTMAKELFMGAGLDTEKASAVAHYLVLADEMGHSTHGLALTAWYLQMLATGDMAKAGHIKTLSDRAAAVAWNGGRLPGAWLTSKAVALASERAIQHGTCTIAIAECHHIGCLAAYLPDATDQGLMVSVASSSPSGSQVAPFGGTKGVFTPNPIGYGIPGPDDPILIDISASITTNNMAKRMRLEGRKYDHDWVMEADGTPSNDPEALERGGTLLPTGGLDHGHKGYGMAIWAEALTQGLAGFGRPQQPKGLCSAVTVQVWDPEAFGGREAFVRQIGWLADACHNSPPREGVEKVRLPGEAAMRRVREARENGVPLHDGIMGSLKHHAEQFGVPLPDSF